MPQENLLTFLMAGLYVALITGTICLYPFAGQNFHFADVSFPVVMAGLFTFSIATGLYYLSAYAFGGKTELAAQFAKIKPLFSVFLAIAILHETISFWIWMSIATITAGLLVFTYGAVRGRFTLLAVSFGLMTSLSWSIGELFVKIGFQNGETLENSFTALAVSTLASTGIVLFFLSRLKVIWGNMKLVIPFALHGVLSFSLAYPLFFKSIVVVGLAKTILINAFWPVVSLLLVAGVEKFKGREYTIPLYLWVAVALLVAGSLIQIVTI